MKRIIRLTESDLTRIVKRVLEEAPTDVIKVKVFGGYDDQKKGYTRSCNIQAKNLKLVGDRVTFDYTIPGGVKCNIWNGISSISGDINASGKAAINCGRPDKNKDISFINSGANTVIVGSLSKEGFAKLSYMCDEYASVEDDEMEDDDMMNSDYA